MNQQDQPSGLISIERVIAFVVGPILVVVSGWASAWLARHVPGAPPLPAEAATIAGGAISVAVGGLVYKWLHGRQVTLPAEQLIHTVQEIPGMAGFGTQTADQLEKLVVGAVAKALKQPTPAVSSQVVGGPSPPAEPIPPASNDPAPASAGQVADAGAAPAS